ncbi:hypothetical protein P1J78_24280, partial [Psychromarinibacter sp. C21-152]|nr:hypothetical protein [Psychromarinibacter sediminicola]
MRNELERATGIKVATETIRKWIADETVPRPPKLEGLARTLAVDPAWLQFGTTPESSHVEPGAAARQAQGATLWLAGMISLTGSGGNVAFADPATGEHESVHLVSISQGRVHRIVVARGTREGKRINFALPHPVAPGAKVIGVVPWCNGTDANSICAYDLTRCQATPRGGHASLSLKVGPTGPV